MLSLSLYNYVLVKKGSIEASNRLGDCRPRCVCCDLRVERIMGFCVLLRYVITPVRGWRLPRRYQLCTWQNEGQYSVSLIFITYITLLLLSHVRPFDMEEEHNLLLNLQFWHHTWSDGIGRFLAELLRYIVSWMCCYATPCGTLFTNPIVLSGGVVHCMVAFSGSLYAGGVVLTFRIWGFSVWSVCH